MNVPQEVLAAAISALASLATLLITIKIEGAVRKQTHEQARALSEHQTAFTAVHNRRAEILGTLYAHIAGLNSLAKDWLRLHAVLEEQRSLLSKLNEEQHRERLEAAKARVALMERRLVDAYKIMVDATATLTNFYKHNRVWLSRETCGELDAWMEPHRALVKELDPVAHAGWLEFAQRLDDAVEPMNQTLAELGLPQAPRASVVEQMNGLMRHYGEYYLPRLEGALQRVEDEFRRVLRVN